MKTIMEPARELKVRAEVDVLVVGAGPAGLMAAEAAAQDKNLKVMLIEQRGYMGGNLTIGLPILSFLGPKGNQVVKGGAQKFIDRIFQNTSPCPQNHQSKNDPGNSIQRKGGKAGGDQGGNDKKSPDTVT